MLGKIVRKIIYGVKADQDTLINYLRKNGASIGEDVHMFAFRNCNIDILNPHLLTIGNHVNIVSSTVLTHDYAWSVIKGKYGEIVGNQKPTTIGNNVFIGDGSIILAGSTIMDNVIIGARSVVSGHLEEGFVYAGSPAKQIMSIDEYRNKRKHNQFQEAKEYVIKYKERLGQIPPEEKLHEYFYLFTGYEKGINDLFLHRLHQCGTYDLAVNFIKTHNLHTGGDDL